MLEDVVCRRDIEKKTLGRQAAKFSLYRTSAAPPSHKHWPQGAVCEGESDSRPQTTPGVQMLPLISGFIRRRDPAGLRIGARQICPASARLQLFLRIIPETPTLGTG